MDAQSKIVIAAFAALTIGAIIWQFDRIVNRQNFLVHDVISCDPTIESCFSYACEEGDEECDDTPFLKITKNARNIPVCANYTGTCPELTCLEGEEECEIVSCSEETLEEGEVCVEPTVDDEDSDIEPEEEVEPFEE